MSVVTLRLGVKITFPQGEFLPINGIEESDRLAVVPSAAADVFREEAEL